ncbi:Fe-S cluster assembly protein SufB [Meiothermus hypogaeus]|uniref:Fe-S cluster assembly protein SufB n=2 Tax=Meiothermus hypogaeus TaxID=884155 RepID=A0A511QZZ0_9DEIN|nr:Fe-S cluster assembly protein SufB [Meiothermus hypogaeus]RIH79576.1 FeS cluster assembly protein SufB [Meiothermus hypogaeus]GEM82928.1 Fe-S cluster assembly protein SufB [Meiothermus hypogaeus NBRC 106114]
MSDNLVVEDIGNEYKYGFVDEVKPVWKAEKGLSRRVVEAISYHKDEPAWMLEFRLKALEIYQSKPVPTWGADLSGLNMDEIYFYAKPTEKRDARSWEEVPEEIRRTYEKLGIPEAERKVLAGVGAQYDSEMVYHQVKKELQRLGVIFVSIEEGLKHHEDLFREYFATVIPPEDNKYAALNSAVWSGGSFVYVPKGVKVDLPLQAYFRVNTAELGQFERTIIVVDEGADMHYIEGCTAPTYTTDSFHSGVIEIVVNQGAKSRYTTIQNWSHNMYNLVTQRALVKKDAYHMWLDGNLGSKVTMKYPSSYLVEEGARSDILSIAFANTGQHQDAGGKLIFAASNTGGSIVSKSISKGSGRSSYRGLIKVYEGAKHVKVNVECDALLINEESRTDTYPYMEIEDDTATVGHEATVSRLNDEQIFYLQSRGLPEDEAAALIVRGFIEPVAKELPLEYAVELNRLIELEMEGSVG